MSITFWVTLSLLLYPFITHAQDPKATITWIVKVPAGTPNQAKVYLAGNQDLFGPWKPNQFQLQKQNDGHYRCEATFPVGTDIEYKFTRGSWASVEKSETGAEIQNRRLRVEKDVELSIEIASWAIPAKEQDSTATGDLRWKDFDSKLLEGKRRVTVWLPPNYKSHNRQHSKSSNTPIDRSASTPSEAITTERYPVVYFLDGQNMFDASRAAFGTEWKADETAKALANRNPPLRLILVAIDNSQERMSEYTPVQDKVGDSVVGGQAEKYLTFITQEIKPWIDSEFATDPRPESTAIAGSSLGGLFALFAAFQKPDVFGRAISMSPSLFWGKEAMLEDCKRSVQNTWNSPKQRLWIDMGTEEGNTPEAKERNVTLTKTYVKLLEVRYSERFEIGTTIAEGARHHESAWADRLPQALRFIFDEKTSSLPR
jgi:predicted alpha/beta superfamily hydrolase